MVTIRRRTALTALLVALPFAATACGGTTHASTTTAAAPAHAGAQLAKQAYVVKMRKLGSRIGAEFDKIYPIDTGLGGSTMSGKTTQRLERAHTVFEGVLATLRTMTPPSTIAGDHRQLETGVAGVMVELAQVIKALEAGNVAAAVVPARLADLSLITSATTSMENKGFDVLGPNAGP